MTNGCNPTPGSAMRILEGDPDNACHNFGNRMPNVKCYEYVLNPDSHAPGGCTRPNFIPAAVAWYSTEGVSVFFS